MIKLEIKLFNKIEHGKYFYIFPYTSNTFCMTVDINSDGKRKSFAAYSSGVGAATLDESILNGFHSHGSYEINKLNVGLVKDVYDKYDSRSLSVIELVELFEAMGIATPAYDSSNSNYILELFEKLKPQKSNLNSQRNEVVAAVANSEDKHVATSPSEITSNADVNTTSNIQSSAAMTSVANTEDNYVATPPNEITSNADVSTVEEAIPFGDVITILGKSNVAWKELEPILSPYTNETINKLIDVNGNTVLHM